MPLIYSLSCTHCDNSKMFGFLQVPFVITDDGARTNLRHPGEERMARAITGLSLRQLRRLGRLGTRSPIVCERCPAVDFYADDELPRACPHCAHHRLLRSLN